MPSSTNYSEGSNNSSSVHTQGLSTPAVQTGDAPADKDVSTSTAESIPSTSTPEFVPDKDSVAKASWKSWYAALKNVMPVYVAVHLAFFVITCLSVLFVLKDFAWQSAKIYTLWQSWHRWDTGHYLSIAVRGYDAPWRTAFFPLYPLLERVLMVLTHNPFTAGLLISNLAGLGMLIVFYRLVKEDFDHERALRTVLYLSVFPTAFFFASGYNESLFLFLSLLSFYFMRRGSWWLAGISGFLATLTRSAGLALFSLYCSIRFHDPLAFSHAQAYWNHQLRVPGYGIIHSIEAIKLSSGFLSFQSLRNLLDLIPDLLILALIVLSFVGPWKLPRNFWAYGFYAAILWLFLQLFPVAGNGLYPLQSTGRYMLEVFPAFIILAGIGKSQTFHMSYVMVSGAILFFLLTQFLTGHWVL